jgi:hypothetical protein
MWSNGGTRVPLRANVCESVYTDGMNVGSLGLPEPQASLDETFSVLGADTMGGDGELGRETETVPSHVLVDLSIKRKTHVTVSGILIPVKFAILIKSKKLFLPKSAPVHFLR